jgi:hypothetical protein
MLLHLARFGSTRGEKHFFPSQADLFNPHAAHRAPRLRPLHLPLVCSVLVALACSPFSAPCQRLRMSEGGRSPGFPARGDEAFETNVCAVEPESPDCYPEGERCARNNRACGPDPTPDYHGCYSPSAPRKLTAPPPSTSPCSHDGECGLADYGTRCERYRVGPPGPSRNYRVRDVDAGAGDSPQNRSDGLLCGCVSGSCRFFSQ